MVEGVQPKGMKMTKGWEHLLCKNKLGELGPFSPEKGELWGPYQCVPDGDSNDARARP